MPAGARDDSRTAGFVFMNEKIETVPGCAGTLLTAAYLVERIK
jgi:hypothetical protein